MTQELTGVEPCLLTNIYTFYRTFHKHSYYQNIQLSHRLPHNFSVLHLNP